jgi:hypothetical protein
MSKECLSIPFIFDGEEYQVVYSPIDIIDEIWIEKKNTGFFSKIFPWSRISNRDWYPAVCQEYNEYSLKHPDFGLPSYKDKNYMEEVMRFYYREWVADVVSSRESREREEEQYNYILNKNYEPDEVIYE